MFFTGNGKKKCSASKNDAGASGKAHEWRDSNEEFRDDATKTMGWRQSKKASRPAVITTGKMPVGPAGGTPAPRYGGKT
jgi:hypothetical protein